MKIGHKINVYCKLNYMIETNKLMNLLYIEKNESISNNVFVYSNLRTTFTTFKGELLIKKKIF